MMCGRILASSLLLSLLAGLLLVTAGPAAAANGPVLTQLARELQQAPMPMKTDFAWLALTQMAAFYREEAERARVEGRSSGRQREAAQWAASVDAYAEQLTTLADAIDTETTIAIAVGPDGAVRLYVDSQPVILSAAISRQQAVYEQRVLERYCVLYPCDHLLREALLAEPDVQDELRKSQPGAPFWSFSQHAGPVCDSGDGLEFQFQTYGDLASKRVACDQALVELRQLAAALVAERQQGVRVDWKRLAVRPAAPGDDNPVQVAARRVIELPLPMLAATPELLRSVMPWLTAQVRGETFQLVVLNAEQRLGLQQPAAVAEPVQRYPAFSNDDAQSRTPTR